MITTIDIAVEILGQLLLALLDAPHQSKGHAANIMIQNHWPWFGSD